MDGHKQNFEGREFETYPLLWLWKIAWWLTRWFASSTPCRNLNWMVDKKSKANG